MEGEERRSGARKREKEKEHRNGAPHRLRRFCLLSSPLLTLYKFAREAMPSFESCGVCRCRKKRTLLDSQSPLSLSLSSPSPSRDFLIKDPRKFGWPFARNWRPMITRSQDRVLFTRVEGYLLRIGPRNFYTSTRSTSSIWPRWTSGAATRRSSRRTHLEEET